MREFKFRIWDKNLKKFLKNTEYKDFAINTQGRVYCISGYFDNAKVDEYDGIEISQFTGLKDKNGKEIFKGDIIKAKIGVMDFILKIEFENAKFMAVGDDDLTAFDLFTITDKCEIVGNIYENKELLK